MEGVLFIIIVFGGAMVMLLSKSEIGRALADRIRGVTTDSSADPAMQEEITRLRHEVSELQERMDFAERMLTQQREQERLPGGH